MALTAVKNSLIRIAGPGEDRSTILARPDEDTREYFCIEDILLSKNIDVYVDGIGKLSFPLSEECIKNMIKISSKAKFGRGEDTVLDTSVRDTQVISANCLKVRIDNDSLSEILERMCSGLHLDRSATLVPHLYNLLIYKPGQFFKMHRDSEKMKSMVATLVIPLPSFHKGGELIIQHHKQKHVFFCSKYPEIIKCVMFYSDCQHEIKEITDGYRIALTYNVVLEMPENAIKGPVDEELDQSVQHYFDTKKKKLVYFLNHSYSEHSLKWGLLKGADRTCALALLAVAKRQGRIPCLSLANYSEIYNVEGKRRWLLESESNLIETTTTLYFWVNENSLQFKEAEEVYVPEEEICYIFETNDMFDPVKTEDLGPTGNEGETRDHWYRRACVVLWENKWMCSTGFKDAIFDLHSLTTSEGNQARIQCEINGAGSHFYKDEMWATAGVFDELIDIVKYLNDSEKAIAILPMLLPELLQCDGIDNFLVLERQFDNETWRKIFSAKKKTLNWESAAKFIESYVKLVDVSKSKVVGPLLEDCLDGFNKSTSELWLRSDREKKIDTAVARDALIGIVYDVVNRINDEEKAIAILSKLSPELLKCGKIDHFLELEKQFDIETWVKIFSTWNKPLNWISTSKFIQAYVKQADVSNSKVVGLLLEDCVDAFIKNRQSPVPCFSLGASWSLDSDSESAGSSSTEILGKTQDKCDALIDIVKYVKDSDKVTAVLSYLSSELLQSERIEILFEFEKRFNKDTWTKIYNYWKKSLNWESTLNFVEDYVNQAADASKSIVVGLLMAGCADDLINSLIDRYSDYSMNSLYVYDKMTTKSIKTNRLCKLLYLCSATNNYFLEKKLIQTVTSRPNVFSSQSLAEIFFRLKELRPDDCAKYTMLCDTALLQIQRDIIEMKNLGESWQLPIKVQCGCEICVKIRTFFHSKIANKVMLPAKVKKNNHVISFLRELEEYPIKWYTERRDSPLVIEKTEQLLKDRTSFTNQLIEIEKQLLVCLKLVNDKDTPNQETATTSVDQGLKQHANLNEDHTLKTKRMKM